MSTQAPRPQPSDPAELFALVAGLDARFRRVDTRLPDETPPIEEWLGVLFLVRDRRFLAPIDCIVEVLEPPAGITPLPGTKPWVLGVANNRGTLLPIFDLAALAYGGSAPRRSSDRILVVRQEEPPCGLLVAEVIGIRHFETRNRLDPIQDDGDVLSRFAESAFELDGQQVPVLALDRIMSDPLLDAAAD